MARHTLGLGHTSCCHVFSSAEIRGYKTQVDIDVLIPVSRRL